MIQTLFKKKPFNIQPWEAKLEFKPWMENKRMKFEIDISAICLLLNKKKSCHPMSVKWCTNYSWDIKRNKNLNFDISYYWPTPPPPTLSFKFFVSILFLVLHIFVGFLSISLSIKLSIKLSITLYIPIYGIWLIACLFVCCYVFVFYLSISLSITL